ncbi:RNA polymerase sigma factor SigJ [uncultured Roseobacter sp.]|uniref:RNA polymerase sigma factor SigJ n=1 Tax=uncultured Roseobacter sp. TaxID=114847 RepID=UPI002609B862|nr:RNA polymerase sigma factor SigJ [uncultured Roseobacter sp.]
MTPGRQAHEFERARPQLVGVAYRLLGSVSEAEDVVQDTALKWLALRPPFPDRPVAWMTTVCTNRCLDILRSSHRKRMTYVGPWLPESVVTESVEDAARNIEMASSLSTAFLLLLERLTPRERAAYLLHDIFGMDFGLVSESLHLSPANCRQLAARARRMVTQENARFVPAPERQRELLDSFTDALKTGSVDQLAGMLSEDVDLRADSGGKATAIRHVLEGSDAVTEFIANTLGKAWSGKQIGSSSANGQQVLTVRKGTDLVALVAFGYGSDGNITSVFIHRNPDKLRTYTQYRASTSAAGGLVISRD